MRKLIILILIVSALAACGFIYAAALHNALNDNMAARLADLGFKGATLPEPEITPTKALYKNITLDADGLSTLDYILISYDPWHIMTDQTINAITLIGLNLTGEYTAENGLGFAGWDKADMQTPALVEHATLIEIKNASLTIFTEPFGGLGLDVNLQARPENGNLEFHGTLKTHQKYLGFDANISGYLTPQDIWDATLEIAQGHIELPGAKASRISGELKITNAGEEPFRLYGKLEAGGLSLYDTAWHNASGTIEHAGANSEIFIGAKSLGHEGLDLSLQYLSQNTPPLSGTIFIPTVEDFLHFVQVQVVPFDQQQALMPHSQAENINIDFTVPEPAKRFLNYKINNDEQSIHLDGRINFND